MARNIYMNVAEGDECRIAVLEDGRLYEFFIDRPSQLKHVGNIYKGIVNNVEPGIQAAFVDIGLERNGFLHVSDVNYSYQGNEDIRELYPRTLRIKEPLPEETLLQAEEERDVEQVEEYVGDGTAAHEARSGAVEAEFLEKLEEEHPGHQVSDSPLTIEPPEKEAPRAEAASTTPPAAPEVTVTAEVVTPSGTAAQQAHPAAADKKRRRRRRKKRSGNGAPQATAPQLAPGAEPAVTIAQPEGAPQTPEQTPSAPAIQPPAGEAARPETPAKTTAAAAPAAEVKSTDAARTRRRRTPKRRGGRLPKRVADELEQAAGQPSEPATPAPQTAPEKPKDIDGQGSGGEGPLPGPMYRYHRPPLPKLQNLLRRNQEVVVQVTKASQGGKGPGLSTFVSLPGRYMVLTPNSNRGGVSRKIEDGGARSDLRKMLDRLPVPEGMGVIVRTAAINRSFEDLNRDLNYLLRVWNVISERIHDAEAPALLYTDSDPAIRAVRDYFTADTSEIVIDDKTVFDRVVAFFDQLMPSFRDRVKLYESDVPLFFNIGLESQLDHIFDKKITLKSGGYLFVEQTEALISIDVNSGKFTSAGDAEKTAYQTNMEAIPEICRQLRLRDLAGIVCCDLIDMESAKHRSDVEHALRRELRKDRARTKVAKMSPFGVIELTRQRVRPSIKNYTYVSCPTCSGFGMVRSAETMCLSLLRRMKLALLEDRVHELAVQVHPHVLSHLHSEFRDDINELEDTFEKRIVFEYAKDLVLGQTRFFYMNDRGVRVLYDMDQRINSFAQGGPKAKTNVPLPPAPSGAAGPAVSQTGEGKGRRRRGGRRQRERELERQAREQRIKQDAGKAVSFGDKLPEVKMEVVKEAPKAAPPAKPGEPAQPGEGKRRRGRRGGRKARERETARSGQPTAETGRKAGPAAAEKPQPASTQASAPAPAEPAKAEARKAAARRPARTAKPAAKETAQKPAKKPTASAGRQRAQAPAKTGKSGEPPKATTRKAPAKKAPAKPTPAKKAATKKAAAPKKTPARKTAAAKTTTRKTPAKKKPGK